ncbi:hypothetical protein MMYC01_205886 [Madurella mycetomatis]|uniref:Uncharacterized protein n=1 Tax=Madurella mycetomatis TaxID=100816 RepID=A0A175W3U1_9PEZI|nr:hypothetical protein MMYC01_205886 [Madurella mycetomatis]
MPATPEYKALMERVGNAPWPGLPGRLAEWRRWWNKKRGRPATADVGVLATLLRELKSAAAEALAPHPVDRVAVTLPAVGAIMEVDMADALEYAGLGSWLGDSYRYQPGRIYQSRAVFAAHGHGLCTSYTDICECWHEGDSLACRLVLFASLTRHALYASLYTLRKAFAAYVANGPQVLDFDGGLDSRGRYASDDEYWAHVRAQIIGLLEKIDSRPVEMVLLGGENGTDRTFLETLRDALAEVNPTSPVSIDIATTVDPTFAAATGMALYARRRQEVPSDCKEHPACEKQRQEERAGGGEWKLEL